MDQKLKFIARYLEGEKIAVLCREFGISRPTGYKLIKRYKIMGECTLVEQKRTPYRYANQLPIPVEALILDIKKEYSNWGAPKIRSKIIKKFPDIKPPAASTIHAVLDRHGLVRRRKGRKRYQNKGTQRNHVKHPNDLWCADYKGEFMMQNRQYCYPLTISDYASRYLIGCDALTSTREEFAFEAFTNAFKEYGLPKSIRTDNGSPFTSGNSFYKLTKLSVWWMRLGINVERIEPGHPEQNGRPHQGIGDKYPTEVYRPSEREFKKPEPLYYPFHDKTITVTRCGRICDNKMKVNLSRAFAGQQVGIKEMEDNIWVVSFLDYDLGYFDNKCRRVEPVDNPFGIEKV